jgi:hypothetical protein
MRRNISNEYNSIISTNREIIPCPLTYGLFATLDDHYRPLSSNIKVKVLSFFLVYLK